MTSTKIIGWLTFLAGIIIIGSTLYFTYNIFTGKATIPQILEFEPPSSQEIAQGEGSGIEEEIKNMLFEQLTTLIPFDSVTKFANLAVWTIGAWILIFGGGKISELGIKLIRVPANRES